MKTDKIREAIKEVEALALILNRTELLVLAQDALAEVASIEAAEAPAEHSEAWARGER